MFIFLLSGLFCCLGFSGVIFFAVWAGSVLFFAVWAGGVFFFAVWAGGKGGGWSFFFFLLFGRVDVFFFFLLFGRGRVFFFAVWAGACSFFFLFGPGACFFFFAVWAGDGGSLTYPSAWLVFKRPNNKRDRTAKKTRVPC